MEQIKVANRFENLSQRTTFNSFERSTNNAYRAPLESQRLEAGTLINVFFCHDYCLSLFFNVCMHACVFKCLLQNAMVVINICMFISWARSQDQKAARKSETVSAQAQEQAC